MLLHDKNMPVYKFMTQEVIVIHLTTPEVIASKKIIKYKLNALPVIDKQKQIIGIVTLDDLSGFLCNRI
jgi:CBS domain-containing protein